MVERDEMPRRRATDLLTTVAAVSVKSGPVDVRAIRRRLGFTQAQFAGYFGFAVATLRHWERGNRQPTGAALVLLQVIAQHPRAVLLAARKARATLHAAAMPKGETSRSHRAPPGMAGPI